METVSPNYCVLMAYGFKSTEDISPGQKAYPISRALFVVVPARASRYALRPNEFPNILHHV